MKITNELIASLKPCSDRHNNYLVHYKNKSHTPRQFMGLRNITHSDKLWVTLRLLPVDKLSLVAADIAETVLHIFEEKYPNDKRPRLAIEAARNTEMSLEDKRKAANAADVAADAAADAAVRAAEAAHAARAAHAAVRAADAARAAAYAAADAAHAVRAAAYAAPNKLVQEKLIRTIILKYMKGLK